MQTKNYITTSCMIRSSEVSVNSLIDFTSREQNPKAFLLDAYKHYQLAYPKFHKMDDFCKLGFLACELLLNHNNISTAYNKEDIAIILASSASSLQTDTKHQATIEDANNYFPSPSIFVYTLPNILIGEIAIRNQVMGENTCFIFRQFNTEFMSADVNSLLNSGRASCCISGWVDLYEDNYEAILYMVEKKAGKFGLEHTSENIKSLLK